jgi:hypothetical protein
MDGIDVSSDARGVFALLFVKDKTGREHATPVLKVTFVVDAHGRAALDEEDPANVVLADEMNGADPATSSIRRPSDVFEHKPGTDVILVGHAHAPAGRSVSHVDVSLRVGPVAKTVRAHGLRVWQASAFGGVAPGPARALREPVPLVYELAWGGLDLGDPERPVGEWRNMVGRGVARDWRALVGQPAAQLEDPERPLRGGRDGVPWCFGALHRHWRPRVEFAGTYDEAWQRDKMPLLPDDFDDRFHVTVPHDQWSPTPLRGDEPIEVLGATPEGAWRFSLPRLAPGFSSRFRGRARDHRTHLDTILIDADRRRVELTWRAAIPIPKKYEEIERIEITEKTIR